MGNDLAVCLIALHFLNAHLPKLDRVLVCGAGQTVTALPHDTYSVEGVTPRRYKVVLDGHGRVLEYGMAGVP